MKNIQPSRYLRLLSYDNACKVIDFINSNDKEDFAHVTPCGVSMQVSQKNWEKVETFIKSLNVRYEVGTVPPHQVEKEIVDTLKRDGVIETSVKVHTTIGLYPDNSFKLNGVLPEHLEHHIQYNKDLRPGRALFLDGKCIYKGIGIDAETIRVHEQLFKSDKYIAKTCTQPYV